MKQYYAFNDLTRESMVVKGINFQDALSRAGIPADKRFGWTYDTNRVIELF